MTTCAGKGRPSKAEGRADPGEARGLTEEVTRFPHTATPEVAEPSEEADSPEETPHLLATTKGRYDLRAGIARMLKPADGSRGPAVCGCGYTAYNTDAVTVHLVGAEGKKKASVSGVFRCDSISACPVCTISRAKEVEERLVTATKACLAIGGMMCALTFTVQRKIDQPLQVMHEGSSIAFRKARQGSGWKKPSAAAGHIGLTTTVECPWGPVTGYGEHRHVIAFYDHRDRKKAIAHCELLISRYLAELDKLGLVGKRQGQKIQALADGKAAATYAAKAAREVAHGWVKEGRKAGSTAVHPFAVAARACIKDEHGNPLEVPGLEAVSPERAYHVFLEYTKVFSGVRQGLISPSLAKRLGIKAEDKDTPPEDAEQQFADEKPVVGVVDSELWNKLMSKALSGTFLSKVETEIAFDAESREVVGWSEIIKWAEEATGVRLDREAIQMTEGQVARNREMRERADHLVSYGLEWRDAIEAARAEAREEFEAGLYGNDARGPTIEEMATWQPLYRPPVRVTVSQIWDEAHERAGGTLTHHGSGIGRVMAHVPDAIEAIRARIEARGQEAHMPSEAEVWATVIERMAA